MAEQTLGIGEVRDALPKVLAEVGRRAAVVDVTRVSAGASRHTFTVTLAGDGPESGEQRLVLQVDRSGGLPGAIDVQTQAALLRASEAAGVPVAPVVAAGGSEGPFGAPYLLARHVDGETLPQRLQRDPAYAAARGRFASQAGEVLAALHSVSPSGLPALFEADQLERVVGWVDEVGDPVPAFELAIAWLREHRPAPVPPRLVHGDFRLGNLIMGPDGIRAVLDWEMTHLGDPVEDLAWVTLRAWRFRGPGEVGGMGSLADLVGAYAAAGGGAVDPERLRWWQVLGTLTWGSICQRQARTHLEGLTRSVELAAIGRRVCETEHDLLELIP
jgi:aminoglycoside phosphotransferase (APT) family kinase protein